MKLLVISDSHDNIVRLRHVLGFAKELRANAVIHCGDWNTPLAVSEVAKSGLKIYGVLGNADIDPRMGQMLFEVCEEFDEDFLKLNLPAGRHGLDDKKIGIHHYPTGLNDAILSQEYDVLFAGHTHQKKIEKYRKTMIVNPGALHRVTTPSFAVYNTETNEVEIIDVAI